MEGIVLSNLDELVKNPEVLSEAQEDDKWSVMEYEIADVKGKCIIASETAQPPDITFVPKLKGWHKIFVASWRLGGGYAIHVKLDTDPVFTCINDPTNTVPSQWQPMEWVEEHFWCCADLTDREITLRKHNPLKWVTPLVWIRCVPMTDEEIAAYKDYTNVEGRQNLHVHFDTDHNRFYGVKNVEDTLLKLYSAKNTDAKLITQEVTDHLYAYEKEEVKNPTRVLSTSGVIYENACRDLAANVEEITKARLDLAHSMNMKLYAGFRMSMASMTTPWAPLIQRSFVNNHPEFYCKTRDVRTAAISSYAYSEVRRYVIDFLKYVVSLGYDGVSLIAHRGIHMAFEQPVLDEFARRNDGLDARRVPIADARLNEVWCYFMTQFFRDLRAELDREFGRHVPINLITGYDPDIAKRDGIDVETLAKEGLIDHVCGAFMDIYENLGRSLGEDGLVDLETYKEDMKIRYMVGRHFGGSLESAKIGYPKYLAIAEKYGIEFFGELKPGNGNNRDFILQWWQDLREIGVKNFSIFNYCHISQDRTLANTITRTGHDTVDMECSKPRYYRVLSIDGFDISTYPPNWVG